MLYKFNSKTKLLLLGVWISILLVAIKPINTWSQTTTADTLFTKIDSNKSDFNSVIEYASKDSLIYDIAENMVYLYGDAHLHYENIDLKAGFIAINLTTKFIKAKGRTDSSGKWIEIPVLKDGEDEYKSDSMEYNGELKKGRVYGLKLTEEGAIVHLDKVLRTPDGNFVGDGGKITTCDADHPHFYFNTSKIKVMPNNKVIFGPANLVIEDVPTPLAIPFGIAPIKKGRRNGIIFPGYGYNQSNQSYMIQNLGYYRGLGPFADITLTTDLYLVGDFRVGLQSRLAKKYKYSGSINLSASHFNTLQLEKTAPNFKKTTDFKIIADYRWDPKLHPGHNLGGSLNFQTAGFNKLNERNIYAANNNIVISSFSYSTAFFKRKLSFTSGINHNQNLATRAFNLTLPSINLSASSVQPFKRKIGSGNKWYEQIRMSYTGEVTNQLNTYDSLIFGKNGLDEFKNLRTGVKHTIPINANMKVFGGIVNISPYINYSEAWYFRDQVLSWNTSSKKIDSTITTGFWRTPRYSTGLNLSTNIYGTFLKTPFKKITAIRHTITPNINFNYQPEYNETTLGYAGTYIDSNAKEIKYYRKLSPLGTAFGGQEMGSIGLSIGNNVQAKKTTTDTAGKKTSQKINLINQLNLSTAYNFLADSLQLSPLGVSFNTVLIKTININAGGSWSFYKLINNTVVKEFYFEKNNIFNPLRFTNANITLSAQINPDLFRTKKPRIQRQNGYYNFDIPWSFSTNINTNFSPNLQRTLNFSANGSLGITPEWALELGGGYDFRNKLFTQSQISVKRKLHCWDLSFSWIPSGSSKSWFFTLRPSANVLQDLKLSKRQSTNPGLFFY